ncbi:MAG: chromosome partitioning protein ParA [Chloracidobacterium sp. CP2_5A]|nr:MAG: chromosome partitioning protein ParA [Chloracidobacterium sp. CP2_5A]
MPKTLAVASLKGGVGKTTTCTNLAAYVAAMGIPTLLVDLDVQGGVRFGVGLDDYAGATLEDVLLRGRPPAEALIMTNRAELSVVLSGRFATDQSLEAYERAFEQDVTWLARLLPHFATADFTPQLILLDTPAGLGAIATSAMVAADGLILPVQCEPLSLRTLPPMLRRVLEVKSKYNPELNIEGVLLTMCAERQPAAADVARQVREAFPGGLVFDTVIPRHEELSISFAVGTPAVTLKTRAAGAQAYIQLGREVIMRLPEE